MARIYRATYTTTGPDGRRIKHRSAKWYIGYTDADGRYSRVAGFTDRIATQRRATELEQAAQRGDRYGEHSRRPLAEHVADWEKALSDKGDAPEHAAKSAANLRRVLDGCGFARWPDVAAGKVEAYLAERIREGLGVTTANHYLQACKGFCSWMVQDRRAKESPLAYLRRRNAAADKRHERRALTAEELRGLLAKAEAVDALMRYGVDGADRAMVYRVAAETGLRANELRTLTAGSFKLDAEPPTVTVAAAYSKRRREDGLPLRPELAEALRKHLTGKLPTAPAFKMPNPGNVSRMIREDLEAARAAWLKRAETPKERKKRAESSFLAYRDEAGRVADFHALRHTFITGLARGGVHPKLAQQLARHSTITLTMDRYTHTALPDLSDALAVLPDLTPKPKQPEQQRATGTAGAEPVAAPMTDSALRELYVDSCGRHRSMSADAAIPEKCQADDTARKPNRDGAFAAPCRSMSASDETGPARTRTGNREIMSPLL